MAIPVGVDGEGRMTVTRPRPTKTAVLLAHQIVAEILRDDLPPGSRLPSERDMLERYQVGRGTLREALRYLELQGVLSIKQGPRGGPIVAAPDGHNLASVLGLLLAMSRTPFKSVVDMRLLFEPPIAACAATAASSDDVAELRQCSDAMADPRLGDIEFLEHNQRFHDLVAAAAHNDVFTYFVTSLHWISDGAVMGISYSLRRRTAVVDAHDQIVQSIERGDPVGAEDAMRRHLNDWAQYVEARHPDALDRPIVWSVGR